METGTATLDILNIQAMETLLPQMEASLSENGKIEITCESFDVYGYQLLISLKKAAQNNGVHVKLNTSGQVKEQLKFLGIEF
ncbi:hypothetical protein EP331_11795 [bacterium]|nr:MAG: hypothetical protein EP331_11795 [bacterium]